MLFSGITQGPPVQISTSALPASLHIYIPTFFRASNLASSPLISKIQSPAVADSSSACHNSISASLLGPRQGTEGRRDWSDNPRWASDSKYFEMSEKAVVWKLILVLNHTQAWFKSYAKKLKIIKPHNRLFCFSIQGSKLKCLHLSSSATWQVTANWRIQISPVFSFLMYLTCGCPSTSLLT